MVKMVIFMLCISYNEKSTIRKAGKMNRERGRFEDSGQEKIQFNRIRKARETEQL